ncbi:MAG: 2-phosphoglycerate kinase [Planctomycetes bacterium]|nr:2-phosphoglycerate kinase [Planctomycetota bacterium]
MIEVQKGERKFPFSEGIMAKSLTGCGLSVSEAYEIVREIRGILQTRRVQKVSSGKLKEMISENLLQRGHGTEERFYRVRRQIRYLDEPLFIVIGGGPGVGKSSISSELGHRLGIDRVIGSDTVREIMRSIISPGLIPTLHESTFKAGDVLKTSLVTDKLIYAFEQQTSLVCEGIAAVMRRGAKEGLHMILNGVHIVPGFLRPILEDKLRYVFQYVINVPDPQQHILYFHLREESAQREADRYVKQIDRIRRQQDYILRMAEQNDVPIIDNMDFERSLRTILEDIISQIEKEVSDE